MSEKYKIYERNATMEFSRQMKDNKHKLMEDIL